MNKLEIAKYSELPQRVGKSVKLNNTEIALFRLSNGEVYAVENKCPHNGGTLAEGIVSGNVVYCPLHEWKICLEDGKVQQPDTGCVKVYDVEVKNDKILLTV
ncbi:MULTISPECIES: nitrite reductase small subunit NirD [Bacillaceae]|uniref:nitrite reductase small subunit NirD n=1 Tax=Bacillaceae TaxID=186817 RepID=UPI001BDF6DDA|nr:MULTISPECIES: nitrite reductase small subunit NirD [Bacillaceae]MDX8359733.1 nitrite reductase small subunit NirD [Cytobacillus sp. IB215316]